jgi:hypothetical protein
LQITCILWKVSLRLERKGTCREHTSLTDCDAKTDIVLSDCKQETGFVITESEQQLRAVIE